MVSEMLVDDGALAPSVVDLIEHIWREATGEVEEMIATPVRDIKVEQVCIVCCTSGHVSMLIYTLTCVFVKVLAI